MQLKHTIFRHIIKNDDYFLLFMHSRFAI